MLFTTFWQVSIVLKGPPHARAVGQAVERSRGTSSSAHVRFAGFNVDCTTPSLSPSQQFDKDLGREGVGYSEGRTAWEKAWGGNRGKGSSSGMAADRGGVEQSRAGAAAGLRVERHRLAQARTTLKDASLHIQAPRLRLRHEPRQLQWLVARRGAPAASSSVGRGDSPPPLFPPPTSPPPLATRPLTATSGSRRYCVAATNPAAWRAISPCPSCPCDRPTRRRNRSSLRTATPLMQRRADCVGKKGGGDPGGRLDRAERRDGQARRGMTFAHLEELPQGQHRPGGVAVGCVLK